MEFIDFEDQLRALERKESLPYVQEAVRSFRGGCNRSAILQIWVAVVTDIVALLEHLADDGNHSAKQAVDKLRQASQAEKREKDFQNFEKRILEIAEQNNVLEDADVRLLKRLKEDRNLCAHPALGDISKPFSPTTEQTKAYLADAFRLVLLKPTLSGTKVLDRLRQDLISDRWPVAQEDEFIHRSYLRSGESTRIKITRFAIAMIVKPPSSSEINGFDPELLAKRANAVFKVALNLDPTTTQRVLAEVLDQKLRHFDDPTEPLIRAFTTMGHLPFFVDVLGEQFYWQLSSYLQSASFDELFQLGAWKGRPPADSTLRKNLEEATTKAVQDPALLGELIKDRNDLAPILLEGVLASLQKETLYSKVSQLIFNLHQLADSLNPTFLCSLQEALSPKTAFFRNFYTSDELIKLFRSRKWSEEEIDIWKEIGTQTAANEKTTGHLESRYSTLLSYQDLANVVSST